MNECCINWNICQYCINWEIVKLKARNISFVDKDLRYVTILHGVEDKINERILIGIFDAIKIGEDDTEGYYLVQWCT